MIITTTVTNAMSRGRGEEKHETNYQHPAGTLYREQ